MGAPVPTEDLTSNVVPPEDLPSAAVPQQESWFRRNMRDIGVNLPPIHPETFQALDEMKNRGWGSGLPHIAYKAGDLTSQAATKLGASPEVSAGLGLGANVAVQAVPALMGGRLMQESAAPLVEAGAKSLMQSALKPTISDLRSGDAANAIDTMLEQGYSPTKGGVEAMKLKIAQLGDEIKTAIADSPATINKNAVANRLNTALQKFSAQVNPQSDLKAVESAWTEFLNHPLLAGQTDMPVQVAQALKQGTYQQLGDKPYGELSGAATEAQKQLARGLKEEISAAVPAVAPLNKAQGELINAKDIAERRALMETNKNPIGLGMLNPRMIPLWLADRNAAIKALIARGMYSGKDILPFTAGTSLGAFLGAQSGKPEGALEAVQRRYAEQQGKK